MKKRNETERTKLRFNLITAIVYIIGIILLVQLFNLQIIHGAEYKEQSNTRLTREVTLEAARGPITDRSGNELATTKKAFRLDLYKSQITTSELNTLILQMIEILEKNGDKYTDTFPIKIDPFEFTLSSEERIVAWKRANEMDEDLSAEQIFYLFADKYQIAHQDISQMRKIIGIRYEISQNGYSWSKPVTISNDISITSSVELAERSDEFQGVEIVEQPVRTYKKGTLASHILGYISRIDSDEYKERKDKGYDQNDYIGKLGIESLYEEYLRGQDGTKQIDMTVDGTITEEYVTQESVQGAKVVLTIDANLQAIAEQALEQNIEKIKAGGFGKVYEAKGGAAVVMNTKTGEVLAMASYPGYEPELFINGISTEKWVEYRDAEVKPLFNRAIQASYAPGSTFKMVTAIAGLETNAITIRERIQDRGIYPRGHNPACWVWTDYRRTHGSINVSDAIKHSCNYFFYEVGYRMGIDKLEEYARYFGLGEKTGIELPGEIAGSVASRKTAQANGQTWYEADTLVASIGQGANDFTPLQMAKYISVLTNGGNQVNPTIIKSIIKADGTEVQREEIENFTNEKLGLVSTEKEEKQLNPENVQSVLEGMRSVTDEVGGTAYSVFRDFDISVGGKTGSAEAGEWVNAWFVGFAPFEDPEIAVVVQVENGGHGYYTAEVVRELIKEYFGMNTNVVQENLTAIPYTEIIR